MTPGEVLRSVDGNVRLSRESLLWPAGPAPRPAERLLIRVEKSSRLIAENVRSGDRVLLSVGRRRAIGGMVRLFGETFVVIEGVLARADERLLIRAEMSSRLTVGALLLGGILDRVDIALPRDNPLRAEKRLVPTLGDGVLLLGPAIELPDAIPSDDRLLPLVTGLLLRPGAGVRTLGVKFGLAAVMLPREDPLPPRDVLMPPRDVLMPPLIPRLLDRLSSRVEVLARE